jgi:2-methylcitrate dehydratase
MADSSSPQLYDQVIIDIKDYVFHYDVQSPKAWTYARLAVLDTIGCGIEGLKQSAGCRNLLGPVVPGTVVTDGFKLPGTSYQLDPFKGAFDFGAMIRYLDHNDGFVGADWGHPSGKILEMY